MSRNLLLIAAVGLIVIFAVSRKSVLDADQLDLRYHFKLVDAAHVNEPKPGDAFAYHGPSGTFADNAICSLYGEQFVSHPNAVNLTVFNYLGESVNWAIGRSETVSQQSLWDWFHFDEHIYSISLNKIFRQTAARENMRESCQDNVFEKATEDGYFVFIVETVYLDRDVSGLERYVKFNPRPIVTADCAAHCGEGVSLETLLDVGWLTKQKKNWNIVQVFGANQPSGEDA
ncbi:hypothetical protein TRL7639_02916 [Falsiruegeria litorea R37]|uniref:Uncharacterized protein n=1 Tax=Falsiruegeria litorea R37 TaxID=1200284 RepID=A0A1Y5T6B3_9RHOB|nr:hypothetical protein [Falsiruegeria litorea]SLN54914.1 hypothetical protein TRL7639_02916 [Falsiruegeria litorea R37]